MNITNSVKQKDEIWNPLGSHIAVWSEKASLGQEHLSWDLTNVTKSLLECMGTELFRKREWRQVSDQFDMYQEGKARSCGYARERGVVGDDLYVVPRSNFGCEMKEVIGFQEYTF